MPSFSPKPARLFLLVLVAATAVGPLSMQIFLPALPAIQAAFGVTAALAQLALSISFFAIAFATLAYGPLSDRFGRRPLLLIGLVLFVGGTVICALAPSIELLIVGRVVQACGGASGLVLARAIVRDLYDRERATTVLAYLTMAMVVAPMIAPTIGGILTDLFGWRASFVLVLMVGAVVLLATGAVLSETNKTRGATQTLRGMAREFAGLLAHPLFRGYAMQTAFGMGMFFTFLGAAPYLMSQTLQMTSLDMAIGRGLATFGMAADGFRATLYGLYFIAVSLGFMVGNFIAAKFSRTVGGDRMIVLGSGLAVVATLVGLGLTALGVWTPPMVFGCATVIAFSNGLAIPNGQSGLVSVNPRLAGSASGLSSFLQMLVASVLTQAMGMASSDTPYPMYVVTLICGVLSFSGALLVRRTQAQVVGPVG